MPVDLPLSSIKGGTTANHVYGAEGTAAIGYGGTAYTVTSDRLGSIRRITGPEGNEIAGFTYDAWGRPEKTVAEGYKGSVLGVANYTGHRYDEVLGLYYAKARIYSPGLGRFLSRDPIRDGLNWYSYCENNPVNRIDPLGLDSYIYYDPDFGTSDDHIKAWQQELADQFYGSDIEKVKRIAVASTTKETSSAMFTREWGAMANDPSIQVIVFHGHGSEEFQHIKISSDLRVTASDGRTTDIIKAFGGNVININKLKNFSLSRII